MGSQIHYLAKVSILAAIAALLMFFEVPVPLMPVFLKLDISDLPAVVGAFLLSPWAGVAIELIKNLIHAFNSQTMMIGEVANFLVGAAFVLPAAYVYRHRLCRSGAVLGLVAGTVSMMLAAAVLDYYALIPLYQTVLHFPPDRMVALGTAANPRIVDLKSFIVMAIVPFNILKGVVLSLFVLMLYNKVLPALRESCR
ncbi:ecf transporter substrate-specific component [Lucifera butyrica]|uniref:Riboflavin transporter n=1 Tax=Lucifera butyrica TaxID=1351585 RepID=A0A498R1D4_9FIRM|nr:ECF transporter S component [Lucifera butyrica]VBB05019.1 ecf transporter substrate-specific component [Lucifera butyrica]